MKYNYKVTTSWLQFFNYIIIFLMLIFTSTDESINVFHFPISIGITFPIEIVILLLCLFLTMIYNRTISNINILLFSLCILRVILFTIGFINRPNSSSNITRYLSVFLWPILYLLTSYVDYSKTAVKRILRLAEFATIIISIQTITSSLLALTSGIDISYVKNFIRIPLAPSNTITCYLILMIPFIYFLGSGIIRNISVFLCVFSIILTRSFSGFLTITVFFLLILFRKEKKKFANVILVIAVLAIIIFIINKVNPIFFERYIDRFNMIMSSNSSIRSESLNGRDQIYKQAIDLIKMNFPYGLGVSYSESINNQLAHNWILEAILQEGLLNLIFVVTIFLICFVKLFSAKNILCKAGGISLALVLIQALFEPSITAFPFDMFLWIFLGSSLCFSNIYDFDLLPE